MNAVVSFSVKWRVFVRIKLNNVCEMIFVVLRTWHTAGAQKRCLLPLSCVHHFGFFLEEDVMWWQEHGLWNLESYKVNAYSTTKLLWDLQSVRNLPGSLLVGTALMPSLWSLRGSWDKCQESGWHTAGAPQWWSFLSPSPLLSDPWPQYLTKKQGSTQLIRDNFPSSLGFYFFNLAERY